MKHKKAFFYIALLLNLLGLLMLFLFKRLDLSGLLSFEFAFVSAFLVLFASFMSYAQNIKRLAKEFKITPRPLMIFIKKRKNLASNLKFKVLNDDLAPKLGLRRFSLFLSAFKLVAYAALILGFLFLQRQGHLNIFAFVLGVCALPLSALVFLVFNALKKG